MHWKAGEIYHHQLAPFEKKIMISWTFYGSIILTSIYVTFDDRLVCFIEPFLLGKKTAVQFHDSHPSLLPHNHMFHESLPPTYRDWLFTSVICSLLPLLCGLGCFWKQQDRNNQGWSFRKLPCIHQAPFIYRLLKIYLIGFKSMIKVKSMKSLNPLQPPPFFF
jgi:hypothetical protein